MRQELAGQYRLELRLYHEAGFLAIGQLTTHHAASIAKAPSKTSKSSSRSDSFLASLPSISSPQRRLRVSTERRSRSRS